MCEVIGKKEDYKVVPVRRCAQQVWVTMVRGTLSNSGSEVDVNETTAQQK